MMAILVVSAHAAAQTQATTPAGVVTEHPRRVLVRLEDGADWAAFERDCERQGMRAQRVNRAGRSPGRRSSRRLVGTVTAPPGGDAAALAASLQAMGRVRYVEPDYVVHKHGIAGGIPGDPRVDEQWALNNTGQSGGTPGADISAFAAWNVSIGSEDVVIGIIDSGVAYTHPDLAPNMWVNPGEIPDNGIDDDNNGYVDDIHGIDCISGSGDPFDSEIHGSHVPGIAAAARNNAEGIAGVAGISRIMALKFLDATGSGFTSDAIECLQYAIDMGADLTNNSWGGGSFSQTLLDTINEAGNQGQLFVAAAGNDGTNVDVTPDYPGSYSAANIINVAASNRNDTLTSTSNFGLVAVDLAAPGGSILSTVSTGAFVDDGTTTIDADEMIGTGRATASGPFVDGGLCEAPGSWSGAVVICERGTFTFLEKANAVAAGGGVAAVIYNSVEGAGQGDGSLLGTLAPGFATIPVVGIKRPDGLNLLAGALGQTGTVGFEFNYQLLSGTSMAAPQVAGAVAVMLGADPTLDPTTIKQLLLDSVDQPLALSAVSASGGRLNLLAALLDAGITSPENAARKVPVPIFAWALLACGLLVAGCRCAKRGGGRL